MTAHGSGPSQSSLVGMGMSGQQLSSGTGGHWVQRSLRPARTADTTAGSPRRRRESPRRRWRAVGVGLSRSDTNEEVHRPTADDRGENEAGAFDWSGVLDLFQSKNAREAEEPQEASAAHDGQWDSEHVEQQVPWVPNVASGVQTDDAYDGVDRAPERAHPLALVLVVGSQAVHYGSQTAFRCDTNPVRMRVRMSWRRLTVVRRIRRNLLAVIV